MTIRLAINGFGRIGRCVLRALYEEKRWDDVQVVAINTLGDLETNAHLLRYDTTHGRFASKVEILDGQDFAVDGDKIKMFSTRDPHEIDWASCDVDVVLECTGAFRTREKAAYHLESGAKKVLISAPGTDCDATVVYGVNDDVLTSDMKIVSNGSCTTNCLAPIAKALNSSLGIEPRFTPSRMTRCWLTCSTRICAAPVPPFPPSSRRRPVPPRRSASCCRNSPAVSTVCRCASRR